MKTISCKALSLLLVFSLLCSFLPVSELSALAAADSGSPFGVVPDSNAKLAGALDGEFAGGDGTSVNPYLIETADQMKNVGKYLDSCFKLTKDIDVGNITPIGSKKNPFTGTFLGNNHTITIDISVPTDGTSTYTDVGLFGYVDTYGTIRHLNVVGSVKDSGNIITDQWGSIGGLVGNNEGYINNCRTDCIIDGAKYRNCIGNFVGINSGLIRDCSAWGKINIPEIGKDTGVRVGGFSGYCVGTTQTSNAEVDVMCKTNINGGGISVGGFAGDATGEIFNCSSRGDVTLQSKNARRENAMIEAGGFIGSNDDNITNCCSTGDVTVSCINSYVLAGGFAGENSRNISNCYSTGNVAGDSATSVSVGGFVGHNFTEKDVITKAYYNKSAEQIVNGASRTEDQKVGFGKNDALINPTKGMLSDDMKKEEFVNTLNASTGSSATWMIVEGKNQNYPIIKSPSEIFSGGDGSSQDPFRITTGEQLKQLDNFNMLGFCYILESDITVSGGITPIGYNGGQFYGDFNGNHKTIKYKVVPEKNGCSLFDYVDRAGLIYDLNIDASIKNIPDMKSYYLGAIAGENCGTIKNCTGKVNIELSDINEKSEIGQIGGIAGHNWGSISNCELSGSIKIINFNSKDDDIVAGGIVGCNLGSVENCSADVAVEMTSITAYNSYAGGLFGRCEDCADVVNCSASGNVTCSGTNQYSTVAGGLIGEIRKYNKKDKEIRDCFASGDVSANSKNPVHVGGLIGESTLGKITTSHAAGAVFANSESLVRMGGLIGESETDTLTDCHADGDVTGSSNSELQTGGFAGSISGGSILNCLAKGSITGKGAKVLAGGFSGFVYADSTIEDCRSIGDNKIEDGVPDARIGGFVAQDQNGCTIRNCYSTGGVTANKCTKVRAGGFIGYHRFGLDEDTVGTIKDCYATGAVSGSVSGDLTAAAIGEFAGANLSAIDGCYAVGSVKGTKTETKLSDLVILEDTSTAAMFGFKAGVTKGSAAAIGGFVGLNTSTGTIANSFFDKQTTGQAFGESENYNTAPHSVSIKGLETPKMTGDAAKDNITGFDFTGTWRTTANTNQAWYYPQLISETSLESVTLPITITDFSELSDSVKNQKMKLEEVSSKKFLPGKINAMANGIYPLEINIVKWNSNMPDTPAQGIYTFEPDLTGYTLGAGVSTPKITVNIASPEITSFTPLVPNVVTQNVANGTARTSLNLPASLEATVDGANKTISGITWTESPAYQPNTAGTYTFTAVLPAGYTLGSGVSMPTIAVTVAAKQENKSSSGSTTTPPVQPKNQTETKVDSTGNTATVTTKPERVITNGNTASIEAVIPSVVLDNTQSPTAGSTVDTGKKTVVMIQLPSAEIKQQLVAKNNVELTVTVPSEAVREANPNLAVTISADKGILEAAKTSLSDVTIKIKDADTQQLAYSWTFKGADLAKSTVPVTDVNIAMSVRLTTEVSKVNAITPDKKGLVLSFNHSGVLPSVASVKISALEKGFKPGQMLYFYYFNPVTKQIEPQSEDPYVVDVEGNVTVPINHCSDYVLLPNAVRALVLDTLTYTMPQNGKYEIGVTLTGAAGQTVQAYSSTNGIAKVERLKNGNYRVTALKPGLTYIMFDVYDRKNKKIIKSHASVRLTVKKGTVPSGNSTRQVAVF